MIKIYENDEIYVSPFIIDKDADDNYYKQWFHDQEVCKYNSHGKMSHDFDPLYMANLDPKSNIVWGVVVKNNNHHIGNVALNIDWINRNAEFTCIFGEKEYWGKGYCTQVLKWIIDHGFNKLNLHKIWLGTASNNIGMNLAAKKCDMELEAELEQDLFIDGTFVNTHRWTIIND